MQKITFPSYDISFDATTAPWGDYRAKVNGRVLFTMTVVDVYGDEWTTAINTFTYWTRCGDFAGKTCTVEPYFDQDVLDRYTGDPDPTALYGEDLLADQVRWVGAVACACACACAGGDEEKLVAVFLPTAFRVSLFFLRATGQQDVAGPSNAVVPVRRHVRVDGLPAL